MILENKYAVATVSPDTGFREDGQDAYRVDVWRKPFTEMFKHTIQAGEGSTGNNFLDSICEAERGIMELTQLAIDDERQAAQEADLHTYELDNPMLDGPDATVSLAAQCINTECDSCGFKVSVKAVVEGQTGTVIPEMVECPECDKPLEFLGG